MAIPIMVIYTLDNPVLLPIFLLSIGICLAGVQLIAERTLLYGRRLLYLNLAVSIITTSLLIFSASLYLNMDLTTLTVGTIFPGIVAHNISRESFDLRNAMRSGGMMLGNFLIVMFFGLVILRIAGG